MDWNSIKLFLAVVEKGNVKSAAQYLGVSSSTLFRQLNAFENDFGRMFQRSAGQYQLTDAGENMLNIASKAAETFYEIERRAASNDQESTGIVRITAPASFAYGVLPKILSELNKDFPDISIELQAANDLVNLTAYKADIALRVSTTLPEQLIAKKLANYAWGIFGTSAYFAQYSAPGTTDELKQHKMVGGTHELLNFEPYQWLDKQVDHFAYRSNDLLAMRALALSGCGLALLPMEFARPELEQAFSVTELKNNQLWLLIHPDLRMVKRVRIVTQAIERYFSENNVATIF